MSRRASLGILLAGATVLLSACGPTSSSLKAGPTPFIPFPSIDTPISSISGAQQAVWSAYEVATVPGVNALGTIPPAPPVINASYGAVPDDVAQQWANAYFRDAAWRRWALLNTQANFLSHLDGPNEDAGTAQRGIVVRYPDCALYPTQMALLPVPPDLSGKVIGGDNWAFLMTYTAPPTTPCTVVNVYPDGHSDTNMQFTGTRVTIDKGWLHLDPLLGDLWITDVRQTCTFQCPPTPAATPSPPFTFPNDDTPIGQATPQQQAVFASYTMQLVPRKGVVSAIPKPPKVDNQTAGVISDTLAQQWGRAVFQTQTWLKWAEEMGQKDFANHLGDPSLTNDDLAQSMAKGGVPALPTCAVYPDAMSLSIITDRERHGMAQSATRLDQFVFNLKFKTPCSVTVTFLDGKTATVSMPKELTSYGSVRDDPLLGEIWHPETVITPSAYGF